MRTLPHIGCALSRKCCRRAPNGGQGGADAPWPDQLLADVAAVAAADFDIVEAATEEARHIDDSLDLVAIAVRP